MKIVIIGPSGSGKTTIINALKNLGILTVDECATKLIDIFLKYDTSSLPWVNREKFQHAVETCQMMMYGNYGYFDRSIIDEVGYRKYYGMLIPEYLDKFCKENRYDSVFVLPPNKKFFYNNSRRVESYETSIEQFKYIRLAYEGYGYELIDVKQGELQDKLNQILTINSVKNGKTICNN